MPKVLENNFNVLMYRLFFNVVLAYTTPIFVKLRSQLFKNIILWVVFKLYFSLYFYF